MVLERNGDRASEAYRPCLRTRFVESVSLSPGFFELAEKLILAKN